MAEVSPAVIKRTQETLGKYVKKPQLTEKLLKKPPFRFLHDIVNVVIKETGFLKGLYKPEELVSDNIKDRDAKISFLQKLIDVTSIATKKPIAAKPSKIVAGQEPERTNELLQIIGMAIQGKVDSKKAVDEWKNKRAKQPAAKEKKAKAAATPVVDTVDKLDDEQEKKARVDSGIVEDGNPPQEVTTEIENVPVETKQSPATEIAEKEVTEPVLNEDNSVNIISPPGFDPSPPTSLPKPVVPVDEEKQELIKIIDEEAASRRKKKAPLTRIPTSDQIAKVPIPPETPAPMVGENKTNSSLGKRTLQKVEAKSKAPIRPRTALRPPSARPATARPGAPRKRAEASIQPDENVPLSDINLKMEQVTSINSGVARVDDDDDDDFIVIEDVNIQDTLLQQVERVAEVDAGPDQGQLVRQILDTQKEFEESVDGGGGSGKGSNSSSSNGGLVNELRDQIQKLTKSVQPLGKFMDFLLEDIDAMQREHEMWRARGKEVAVKMAREKNATEVTVLALHHQLEELTSEVAEKESLLATVHENILMNEERIAKLFRNS